MPRHHLSQDIDTEPLADGTEDRSEVIHTWRGSCSPTELVG